MTTTQQQPGALAIIDARAVPLAAQVFGEDRLQLLAEQVGRGWKIPPTPAELEAIALICKENRWNIFAKPAQVHFVKRYDSRLGREIMTPQPSIDGMRLAAARSRNYIGPAGYSWCGDDGQWKDVWLSPVPPRAARAGVFVRGQREPMYAVAMWDEWRQEVDVFEYDERQHKNVKTGEKQLAPFWAAKPAHMLAKTAESIIIKQVAPAETDGMELAHLEELDRLEAPVLAAKYDVMMDEHLKPLPMSGGSSFVPTREQDVEDLPRAQVEQQQAAPVAATPSKQRGDLLKLYADLYDQAVNANLIVEGATEWVLRDDLPDVGIISLGTKLRGLLNQATIARSHATQQQPTSEIEDLPGAAATPHAAAGSDAPTDAPPVGAPAANPKPKVEMVGVRHLLYERVSAATEEAANMEVDINDLRIETWPAPAEEVLRKVGRMEDRIAEARALQTEEGAAPLAF